MNAKVLYDCHMHTSFSGDSEAPMEEMVRTARKKGLAGITFTDHLDWDYHEKPGLFDLDLKSYTESVRAMQAKYSDDGFHIYYGIELGLQPHLAERHARLLARYPFDYVIGSTHVVDGYDPYYPLYFEKFGVQEGLRRYYRMILENIRAFPLFDSLGHLDYILRYLSPLPKELTYKPDGSPYGNADFMAEIDAILLELISRGIALELNTGSYRKGRLDPNPERMVLKRYYELGGRKITLGADAHSPEHIALGFTEILAGYPLNQKEHFSSALSLLKETGFDSYLIFDGRRPRKIPLKKTQSEGK